MFRIFKQFKICVTLDPTAFLTRSADSASDCFPSLVELAEHDDEFKSGCI